MRVAVSLMLLLAWAATAVAAELSPEAFLAKARNPNSVPTYAKLDGTVKHLRRGGTAVEKPLYFGVIIMPDEISGQIIIDNKEGYLLSQLRDQGEIKNSVVPMNGSSAGALAACGIDPGDLTMSFLFYKFLQELPGDTVKMLSCRVLLLQAPENTGTVKVYIAKAEFFPVKAEFFKPGEESPYRTLEVNSFREKNDLYYTDEMSLYGPGWRSVIKFPYDDAELGRFDSAKPVNVVEKLR